jgi:1-acyl-sn-glycerol-3-phosphate acyltransferase
VQGLLQTPFYGHPLAPRGARAVRHWHGSACRDLGVHVIAHGQAVTQSGVLYVCNHISWLDIPVLGSQLHGVRFLAKDDIRRWPLIGWLATRAGSLFIMRGNGQQNAASDITAALRAGESVLLFPEGTTTDGLSLRRFHPRLMRAAQEANAIIQPIALRYLDVHNQPNPRVAYIDDDSFGDTLQRIVSERGLRAEVQFLPAIETTQRPVNQIAREAYASIAQALPHIS